MDPSHFRVTRTAAFDIAAPPSFLFPLFGPDREGDWAWGWSPEPVYPLHITAEDGAVFKTHHSGDATWLVTRREPDLGIIEYATFRPDDRVGRIAIQVTPTPAGSQVVVTYSFTALSATGSQHIGHFTAAHYAEMIAYWEKSISHFLLTGETLKE